MTLDVWLREVYRWADARAPEVLLACALVPVVGTIAAWIGKGGKTDTDGRAIASALFALALLAVFVEVAAIGIARSMLGLSILDANVLLLLAPFVCLLGTVVGIRRVFPLSELGSVKTALDLALLVALCLAGAWLMSRFRWGVVFFGSLAQLGLLALVVVVFVARIVRRVQRTATADLGT